jgi:hypothetical protein
MLEIENTCKLCQDTYHLTSATNGAWPKFFGTHHWPRFSKDFRGLVYSYTEEDYMAKYELLKGRLASESKGAAWVQYLETSVHEHRRQFVRAFVQEYWFNLEKEGSSPGEANHSSYVGRIGPVSVEQPAIMVEKTLVRHSDICKERNDLIVRYRAQCIAKAATEHMELQDKTALLALSMWGYELWVAAREESPEYGPDLHRAVDFEEIFNVHMSAFTRHKSTTNNLFTATQNEDGVLQQEPLKRQGPPRELGGRLRTKRLKSNQEKVVRGLPLAQSKPRPSACSFCCLTGHKRGAAG